MKTLSSLRRWQWPIVALLMLFGVALASAPVFAQTGTVIATASPSDATPNVGQQIVVEIRIDMTGVNAPDNKLGSYTATLGWNPAVLSYVSNGGLPAGFTGVINTTNVATGHLAFNGANATGATGDVLVLTATFNTVAAGSSDLDLAFSAMAAAETFKSLTSILAVTDGQVTVPSVSGAVTATASPSNAAPNIGQQIDVEIHIDMTAAIAPDNKLGSFSATLNWDPAVLTYVSNGGLPSGFTGVVNVANVGTGQLICNGANAQGAEGNVLVLTVTFNAAATGTSDLDLAFSAMAAATTFQNLLPILTVNDGSVVVSDAPTCYALTLTHTGQGSDPTATPPNSTGCPAGQYIAGHIPTLTASPSAGWTVGSWTGTQNDASTATTNTVEMPAAAHTASVNYVQIMHNLTVAVDPAGGGTTTPAAGVHSYAEGSVVDVTAAPAAGYLFDHWSGDCTGSGACQVTMSAAKTVTAHFAVVPPTCYALTLTHAGQGSNPVASPANSAGCAAGQYVAGEAISLSGAAPASGWEIGGWTGTSNNASKAATNSLTMPASAHTAGVTYTETTVPPACYALTLTHTGQGSDPVASPANSAGCAAGQYVAGEAINLSGAAPASGWQIGGWTGTSNNASKAATNSLTMPAGAHTAGVTYTETVVPPACYALTLAHTGEGSNPVASPANSAGCDAGQYVAGEAINLSGAVASSDWEIDRWEGTDDDTSTAATNSLTMPANAHTARVIYMRTEPAGDDLFIYMPIVVR